MKKKCGFFQTKFRSLLTDKKSFAKIIDSEKDKFIKKYYSCIVIDIAYRILVKHGEINKEEGRYDNSHVRGAG